MKRKIAISLTVLAAVLLLSGWACNGSQYHNANRASKQVADDIHEFALTVTRECGVVNGHCMGRLADDEARNLAQWAADASRVSDEFNTQLTAAGTIQGTKSQQILAAFNNLSASINKLNESGALHLRSPESQRTFQTIYASIQASLVILQNIISGTPPQSQNKPSPMVPLQAAVDPELLIAALLSVLKLVAQAKADGSLTDEQLQAAVAAENEDTRKVASDLLAQLGGK